MKPKPAMASGLWLVVFAAITAGCGSAPELQTAPRTSALPPVPPAEVVLQLIGPAGPGPSVDSRGRLVAMGETLGHFDEHEDGALEFTSIDGRSIARAETDGRIRTPGSILDTRLDSAGRLSFGDESIFIDAEGRVTGDVAREGLRFEGVTEDNRRLAMFCLLLVITLSGDAAAGPSDEVAAPPPVNP